MSDIHFNINQERKVPIKRNNLFYDSASFKFEESFGREYVESDLNQTIVLYQVDLNKTNSDVLYGETKKDDIVYKTPVEIPCMYKIEKPELKSYDKSKNLGTYQKTGKLSFSVYDSVLKEFDIDIRIGDYVGIQITESHMEYFVVNNDGRNNYDNKHTMFGLKPYYRSFTANPIDVNEFDG